MVLTPSPPPERVAPASTGRSGAPPYRVDWWLPLIRSPGEWGGRWDPAADPVEARAVAAAAIEEGAALARVRVTMVSAEGDIAGWVVVDAAGLAAWDLASEPLPSSSCEQGSLPPLGREGLVHSILARCRRLLLEAVDADLIEPTTVSAVVEIVDQAFVGVGPALAIASAREGRINPGDLG